MLCAPAHSPLQQETTPTGIGFKVQSPRCALSGVLKMTELAVSILRRISADLSVFDDGRDIPEDTLDYFIVSIELVYRELIVLETTSQSVSPVQQQATANVRICLSTLRSLQELRRVYSKVALVLISLCLLEWLADLRLRYLANSCLT